MMKFRYILGLSLLLPAFAFAPVLAESNTTGSGDTGKATTPVTPSTVASSPAVPTNVTSSTAKPAGATTPGGDDPSDHGKKIGEPSTDPTEMKGRLERLKTDLKIKLDDPTKKRIELKCKPAQTIVQGAEKNDKDNGTKRDDVYKKITDSIDALVARLKTAGVDTTAIVAAETTLAQKVATFNTDMTTYRQALTDLHALDCTTDPTAFQAALIAARTDREKVRTDALDIRTFITTTLKPALEAVKAKLKPVEDGQPPKTTADTKTTDTKTTTTSGGTH